jgi:hypothetical protein
MKNIITTLILLSLFACKAKETEQTEVVEQATKGCIAADFFDLKNTDLQTDFFAKLDAAYKAGIIENGGEVTADDVWQDITPEALQQFLGDAEKGGFAESKKFEKEYLSVATPSDSKNSANCMDRLSLSFDDSDCSFSLAIIDALLDSDNECTESMGSLVFKITDGKIVDFERFLAPN